MNNPPALRKLVSPDTLLQLADSKSLVRGMDYFKRGAVTLVDVLHDEVDAEVVGGDVYEVRLYARDDGELGFECDCPVGYDGVFCKHAVATALAWFAQDDAAEDKGAASSAQEETGHIPSTTATPRPPRTQAAIIARYVLELDEDELRQLLIGACQTDKALRDKLLLRAQTTKGSDLSALKSAARQATRTSGFLDWREAATFGEQLGELAELLRQRIADGDARLIPIIEDAIHQAEASLGQLDDSNGEVYPNIEALQEVHLAACKALHPDPVALAERLYRYQMAGDWDTFYQVLPQYAEPLGATGLARYEALLRRDWDALPVLRPESKDDRTPNRFRIEGAMESLVRERGDVQAIATVLQKNLSNAGRFLKLAELYRGHGNLDEALDWGRQGIEHFGAQGMNPLVDFCIDAHLRRQDRDAAQALAWARFIHAANAHTYGILMAVAKRLDRQAELSKQALGHLTECMMAEEKAAKKPSVWFRSTRSELVDIHLQNKQPDEAWALFVGGNVSQNLWEPMAKMRGKTHPEDALRIYRQLLPIQVNAGTGKGRYDEAFKVVLAIQALSLQMGRRGAFEDELAGWRMTWKAKRNFMKLLGTLR
jgi:hypothetical protein